MKIKRRLSKVVKIGNIRIGGNNPIAIQSMTKTKTEDTKRTIRQIRGLEKVGCQIVRVAIKDAKDAKAIKKIKQKINIPLVADIHFDWRLSIEAIDNGADKIRLNPGNIHKEEDLSKIVTALKSAKIPLRIGVNSGSVRTTGTKVVSMSDKLVDSALNYIKIIEQLKFYDIVISLKASNVADTLEAYRKIAKLCNYPLHLGVTAAGLPAYGIIKSSVAIGALLLDGIGDTVRVSLTTDPKEEVKVAKVILQDLGLRHFGPEIISCPTCGRCEVNLVRLVKEFENKLSSVNCKLSTVNSRPVKVAIMGCVVNGPGEAGDADIGVAFGRKGGLLFKNGKSIKKVSFADCANALLKEMEKING